MSTTLTAQHKVTSHFNATAARPDAGYKAPAEPVAGEVSGSCVRVMPRRRLRSRIRPVDEVVGMLAGMSERAHAVAVSRCTAWLSSHDRSSTPMRENGETGCRWGALLRSHEGRVPADGTRRFLHCRDRS